MPVSINKKCRFPRLIFLGITEFFYFLYIDRFLLQYEVFKISAQVTGQITEIQFLFLKKEDSGGVSNLHASHIKLELTRQPTSTSHNIHNNNAWPAQSKKSQNYLSKITLTQLGRRRTTNFGFFSFFVGEQLLNTIWKISETFQDFKHFYKVKEVQQGRRYNTESITVHSFQTNQSKHDRSVVISKYLFTLMW